MGGESGVWNLNSGRSMNYMWKFLDNLTSVCLVFFFYSQKGSRTSGFGSIVVGTLAMRSLQSREQKEHRIGCLSS